jgi:hypothetical protein
MNEFVVGTPAALSAAILAGARPTYEAARLNPFTVQFGTCTYTFKKGLHERTAARIAHNARKMYRTTKGTP